MATARIERRLAAILAADVVGYSRLMEHDEQGTLERLKRHRREFVDPLVIDYQGRMVKLMGDGALVEFASVVVASPGSHHHPARQIAVGAQRQEVEEAVAVTSGRRAHDVWDPNRPAGA
jgi:class 3 adenylate cyclase